MNKHESEIAKTDEILAIPEQLKEIWMKRMKERKCIICGAPMKNGYDSIQKKISKYLWVHTCDCAPDDLVLCIG